METITKWRGAARVCEPEHVKRHLIWIYASKVEVEFGGGGAAEGF